MSEIILHTSELRNLLNQLHAGDRVLLSGKIYTARDEAHKRIFELLDSGSPLPFELKDSCIYYAGPTPSRPGMPVGSCGPTTSGRMDAFAPRLISLGQVGMIGKGSRSAAVVSAMQEYGAVYFCATGGAGALIAKCVTSAKEIAFQDLGCEAIRELTVSQFPLVVGIDSTGCSILGRRVS